MGDAINRRIIVTEYSTDFRKVTKIVREPVPTPGPSQVVLLSQYLGINASDIKYLIYFFCSFLLFVFFIYFFNNYAIGLLESIHLGQSFHLLQVS